jgi:hypothetical protein
MRLITGFLLGGALAAGALGVAVSQTRPGATGGPTTGQAAAPAGINRVNDVLKLMQQAADAAAKAKAAQTRADAAKALADKAEADRRAADAAAGAGATAAQLDARRKAAEARAEAERQAAAAARAEAERKLADARAQRVAGRGIDWQSAAGAARTSDGERLAPNLDRAAIDKTQVPILLPTDAKLLAGARIYTFGDYYTITADTPGAGVSLTGTTAVVPLPAATPLKISPTGPESVTSQRTVDGQLISFVRYGVLYTVEVRCDAPTDPRCADDNYARGLAAKTTAVVMGAAARAAAGLGG